MANDRRNHLYTFHCLFLFFPAVKVGIISLTSYENPSLRLKKLPHKNKSPAPHSVEAAGVSFSVCVVACSAELHHAAGNAQRSSNSGQDGDQRLDNGFPNCFLVHFVN